MIDAFEFKFCYYQVFEFIEGGLNLKKVLSTRAENAGSYSLEQMLNFAKVMMASINAFHNTGIVHCDLKPDNVFLIHDPEIKIQYRLKLIDIDFSVLSDATAPWDGKMGYVGTENYLSPEHLLGKTPQKASDIFTCGIMLYELLSTKGYPYLVDNPDQYRRAALTHTVEPPALPISFCGDRNAQDNATAIIHQALNQRMEKRPSAEAILDAINAIVPVRAEPLTLKKREAVSPLLELRHESGKALRFSINTKVGNSFYKAFGDDSQFVDPHQFTVEKEASDKWSLIPNLNAKNETLLNGKAVQTATALKDGDTIGIGKEAKKVTKLPLTVSLK
jgi:serine/threonine protein kinase